jgi:group I intron endonuclease
MKSIKRKIVVYRIICLVNDKQYIGITSRTLMKRWRAHVCDARTFDRQFALQRAIAAHGPVNFEIQAVEIMDDIELARSRERQLIAECGTLSPYGYNLTTGGDGAIGVRRSLESRAKISAILLALKIKRAPISEETRKRQRQSHLGKKATAETRQKMSAAHKGRPPSEATLAANRGRPVSAKCRERTAAANKARIWTDKARQKLREARSGNLPSAASIEKTAKFNRGRKLPDDQKQKMSEATKAWWDANRLRGLTAIAKTRASGPVNRDGQGRFIARLAPTPEVRQRQGRP